MYVRAIAKSNAGMGSLLKNLGHGYGTTARKREGGLICASASARRDLRGCRGTCHRAGVIKFTQ